ncbi:MAG TPA: RNA 2',3'-cyclic phosphodiesterase [Candidatus Limnocylindrales bacterium]|jgi:2'-5' RNA ligase|nr:RNA 2',3'-cyclic phosphodiesterase [Candidatus Limnocylindrales bacterium]
MTRRHYEELAPGRRLFVAIPLPDDVRDAVAALVAEVQAAGNPGLRDVRWVRLEGLHLTLRFLGPTADEAIADLATAVDRTSRRIAPFDVAIHGAGAFPSLERPRTLWLGVTEGQAELANVVRTLDEELTPLGRAPDDRPFQAHLTLARSDGVRAGPAVARRLIEAGDGVQETFRADRIVLFESVQGDGRSRYVAVHEAPLR